MGGVVFVISAKFAEHWDRAVTAEFWETVKRVSVEENDLLVFWQAGEKRFLGVARAVAPVEPVDYGTVERPWLAADLSSYQYRYRFELIDNIGDDSMKWPGLMQLIGQKPTRGANTAPVHFEESGAVALAEHLQLTTQTTPPNLSPAQPVVLSPDTPISKPFEKRVDYSAPAGVTIAIHDPDAWGSGLATHRQMENAIAVSLLQHNLKPLAPILGGPNFDLAWVAGETMIVCEVKSITPANERSQIRLGLGQVLDYAFRLGEAGHTVKPWLVLNQEPSSPHWAALCDAHGVILCWPATMDNHLTFG